MPCIVCNGPLIDGSSTGKVCSSCIHFTCTGRHCRLRERVDHCSKCIFSGDIGVIFGLELEFDIIELLDETKKQPPKTTQGEAYFTFPHSTISAQELLSHGYSLNTVIYDNDDDNRMRD